MILLRRQKCNFINKIAKINTHTYDNIFLKNIVGGGGIAPKSNHGSIHEDNYPKIHNNLPIPVLGWIWWRGSGLAPGTYMPQ